MLVKTTRTGWFPSQSSFEKFVEHATNTILQSNKNPKPLGWWFKHKSDEDGYCVETLMIFMDRDVLTAFNASGAAQLVKSFTKTLEVVWTDDLITDAPQIIDETKIDDYVSPVSGYTKLY
jgi:hypothetical protein